jgi:4-diphosphocytidyl-2C-methyl-D-erythritol kinase
MRAGILAHANDLMPAAQHVAPGLVALRRGMIRALGTAVGQSGSGPTLWVIYPSVEDAAAAALAVRDAFADGRIVAPGDGPPAVHVAPLVLDRPAIVPTGSDGSDT